MLFFNFILFTCYFKYVYLYWNFAPSVELLFTFFFWLDLTTNYIILAFELDCQYLRSIRTL